ncbi:MAG: phage tail tape measure protein [Ruminococcus sp.]|nr:phage tail tape measure protein [Ruminococcus sp.]
MYELGDAIGHIKMDSSGVTAGFSSALSIIGQFVSNIQTLSSEMQRAEADVNQCAQTMASSLQGTAGSVTQAMQQTQTAAAQTSAAVSSGLAGAANTATQAMNQTRTAVEQASAAIGEQLPAAAEEAAGSTEELNDSLDETNDTIRRTEQQTRESSKQLQKNMQNNEHSVNKFGEAAKKAADIIKKAFIALTAVITTAFAGALKVGTDFEAAMSQVAATMGTTVDSIGELTDIAKEMGESTKFSATQAAEALNYLALAGYEAQEQIAALPTVLNLAAAGGMDLAYASDLVTDSMSALGLTTAELVGFSDQLAKASQKSNTSVAQLGEAIIQIGGTAKILAGGTTELNTALGILADNGIKGAEGGTALRQVLLNLTAPTDKAREFMDQIGLSAFDAAGNMRPLNETFRDLYEILNGATAADKQYVLSSIFDARQLKSAEALLANYGERWNELSKEIENSAGAAADMADTMNDNLKGAVTIMQSALEGLGITVYGSLELPMKTAVKTATSEIDKLNKSIKSGNLSASVQKLSESFAKLVETLAKFAVRDAIPAIISMFEWIANNGETILTLVTAIGAAFLAWKFGSLFSDLAKGISKAITGLVTFEEATNGAITAQAALNTAISANKFIIIGTAIAALVTAIATAGKDMGVLTNAFKVLQVTVVACTAAFGAYILATKGAAISSAAAAVASSKLVIALKAVLAAMVANPIVAVTVAITALAAAIGAAFIVFRKAEDEIPPSVQAVTDKYKEQIETLKELRNEYDELKTAAEEANKQNDENIKTYEGLYERLQEHLDEQGKVIGSYDTVRNLVNQMNELYPDSIKLIGEQGDAYVETAKSMKDYIKYLGEQAYLQLNASLYQKSVVNLEKVKDTTEEAKQAWLDAGAAYEKAAFEFDHYVSEELATEEQREAARAAGYKSVKKYLEVQKEVAQEELDNLNQIYVTQNSLLNEAEQEVEEYEQKIVDAKMDSMRAQGEIFDSQLDAQKDFYERQAEQYRDSMINDNSSEILLRNSEENLAAMNDKLSELEDKYKKHQLSGEGEYLEKRLAIIEEANVKELADWWEVYDKTLEDQKKLNDDKIKADKEAAEKQTEEAKKAAEKRLKDLQDSFDKEEKALDTRCKLGEITETQYYDELEKLLAKYAANGLDLWEEYGDNIKIARKEINDKITEEDRKAAEKSFSVWSDSINSIIDKHKKKYDELIANQDKLANSLANYGDLYTMVEKEIQKSDGTTEKTQKMKLENLDKQLSAMDKYSKSFDKLKNKNVSEGLLSEILSMDVEKGQEYMDLLNKMSASELKSYSDKYDKKQEYAQKFAKDFYASEIENLEKNFADEVRTVLDALPPETKLIGEDSINGFIEGIESKKSDSSAAMSETMNGVIEACRKTLDTHSPSVVFNDIGVNTLEGFEQGLSEKAVDVYSTMEQIGRNFVDSILKGMQSQWEILKTWFASAASSLAFSGAAMNGYIPSPANNSTTPSYSAGSFSGSYKGITKQEVVEAIRETYPDGDVVITVSESEFARISRKALNNVGRQTGRTVINN